jgi:hypothetical protein
MTTVPAAVQEQLEGLLKDARRLSLSMKPDSFADRFEFVLTLMLPARGNSSEGSSYLIACDKDELAAAVFSARGQPFAYATTGFLGELDPTGQFCVCEDGAPRFVFGLSNPGGQLEAELAFVRGVAHPSVEVDLGPFLQAARKKAVSGTWDAERRTIQLVTDKARISVVLPEHANDRTFPVQAVAIASNAGLVVVLSGIRTDRPRSPILGLDQAAFRRAGLGWRPLPQNRDVKLPLLVPLHFGETEPEERAIERLRDVLPEPPQPTTRSSPASASGDAGRLAHRHDQPTKSTDGKSKNGQPE